MTSGGWHSQEQRHGRHRQGATGAWTPTVRPTEASPAHAVRDRVIPLMRPSERGPAWPAHEEFDRPADWPPEPFVPPARQHSGRPAWPTHDDERPEPHPALRRHRHAAPPGRRPVPAPLPLDAEETGNPEAVVYALPDTAATGLRKFDLGNVPASVTPPRSWRRAAWFAVGTSAAVVLGLTVAAGELMGRPVNDNGLIDALPAYPTGPLTLEKLPNQQTTTSHTPVPVPTTPVPRPSSKPSGAPPSTVPPPAHTASGGTTFDSSGPHRPPGTATAAPPPPVTDETAPTTALPPVRETVGPAVMPTDAQAMGDRTEEYFSLVTTNPAAANAMTTGTMAREGQEGIQTRYAGVRRVEVQNITIDRSQAVTMSTLRIFCRDGTSRIEHRQLTFTWGGDPKITDDAATE